MNHSKKKFLDWAIPLLAIFLLAPFTPVIDLTLANYFFDAQSQEFSRHSFFWFMYTWGLLPGQVVGVAAILLFLLSFIKKRFFEWRKPALQVILTIGIGAGLITHVVLKEGWKRPRPKQVEQYGGTEEFRPFYQPNFSAEGQFKSFPSGHTAMGFCFFAFTIQARRTHNKPLFYSSIAVALLLGISLSLTRIAQGGHFFSDTLISACLMWITASFCDRFLYSSKSDSGSGSKSSNAPDFLSENTRTNDNVQATKI